jgi:GxxExxY protein
VLAWIRPCSELEDDLAGQQGENPFPDLTRKVIGAAIEVHKALGPGLLESVYEQCLCRELDLRGIAFEREVSVPISYKGIKLASSCRLDIFVEQKVVIEVKAIEKLEPVHSAQVLTYLQLTGAPVGLLLNFNVVRLTGHGLKRLVMT